MTHQELGQQLKIAREQLGFEIKESAASIKIDAKFVEKMEIGDFTFLPDVYVRSFLKEYAVVLHLDPDEVLEAYKGLRKAPEVKHPPVQAPPPVPVQSPPPPPPSPAQAQQSYFDDPVDSKPQQPKVDLQQKLRNWIEAFMSNQDSNFFKKLIAMKKSYLAIGAVIVVLAVVLYVIFSGKSNDNEIRTDGRQVDELLNGVQDTNNKFQANGLADKKLPPDADTVILVINSKDTTKVRAIIDKKDTLKSTVVDPTQPVTYNASKRIDLRVDNSSLLSVTLNDKPLELPKKKGVQTLNIDKNGLIKATTKNAKPPKKKTTTTK
ncbi:MAG: helix-turn-helix domain-containing protein [Ignavibacteriales bacterium]|nr:helix-turn-helix domain-containing protein [Ignavibacteriales bacterium]